MQFILNAIYFEFELEHSFEMSYFMWFLKKTAIPVSKVSWVFLQYGFLLNYLISKSNINRWYNNANISCSLVMHFMQRCADFPCEWILVQHCCHVWVVFNNYLSWINSNSTCTDPRIWGKVNKSFLSDKIIQIIVW